MPDQSTAATEQSIIDDLSALPPPSTQALSPAVAEADFSVVLRGYDRDAVDAYVRRTNQVIAELRVTQTTEGAVQRALERVGDEVAGVLRRAHETADQITARSRSEADDRLQAAIEDSRAITVSARASLRELDVDTDRVWAERQRIIEDARALAEELLGLADAAAERFPSTEEEAAAEDVTPLELGSSSPNGVVEAEDQDEPMA
jgi:DivIVA domain-containing protein